MQLCFLFIIKYQEQKLSGDLNISSCFSYFFNPESDDEKGKNVSLCVCVYTSI